LPEKASKSVKSLPTAQMQQHGPHFHRDNKKKEKGKFKNTKVSTCCMGFP
jgi:hypothetical protein